MFISTFTEMNTFL